MSFNPTHPDRSKNRNGWVSPWICGLNQGPIILMIENHESELIWNMARKCPHLEMPAFPLLDLLGARLFFN
jgi:hypothetical protein